MVFPDETMISAEFIILIYDKIKFIFRVYSLMLNGPSRHGVLFQLG